MADVTIEFGKRKAPEWPASATESANEPFDERMLPAYRCLHDTEMQDLLTDRDALLTHSDRISADGIELRRIEKRIRARWKELQK